MSEFTRGPTLDTASGDIVAISVPPDGPYGVNFTADADGNAAVIHSFDRMPNGKFGPLQKHGGLHYGDVLFEINDVPLVNLNFNETIRMVSDKNMLKKNFKFINSKLYYRKKKSSATSAKPTDGKNNFLSVVKRTRLAQIDGRKVTEFEVACQFTVVSLKVHKEIVYQWSVWKRFSDFSDLHTAIKRALGWQMDHIEFPSSHTFVLNKFSPDFVETRRDDLKEYWSKVLVIDKITDFTKHHCSQELKSFLEVDENTQQGVAVTADTISEDQSSGGAMEDGKSSAPGGDRRSARVQRGMSMRRKSTNMGASNKQSAFNFDDETPVSTAAIGAASNISASSSQKPASPKVKSQEPPAAKAVNAPADAKPAAKPAAAAAAAQPAAQPAAAVPTPSPAAPPPPAAVPKEVAKPTAARANLLGSIAALRKD